jgi:predicted dehydrogenase
MTIVGSKKMIVYDDVAAEGKVRIYDKGVLRVDDGRVYGEFQYKLHSGDIYMPQIDMAEPLRNECAHFIECIEQNRSPRSDGQDGLRVIKVLEAAQSSLEQRGAPVPVAV